MDKEVKIMGAGPAGLVAGINLARSGYNVTIFEKSDDCGKRFNGDFQGLENWSRKEDVLDELKLMGVEVNFHCEPFSKLKAYNHDLELTDISSDKPLVYLVKRGVAKNSLDAGLKQQALAAGVNIVFNKSIKEEDADIVAKGPSSADIIAKGITFKTNQEDVWMGFLDDDIAPKGYAYLLITKGQGCLVTVLCRHFSKEKEYYEKMREKVSKVYNLEAYDIKEFGGYGNFFLVNRYVKDSRLYVGEAAGMQDFLWGFGMRYAMVSGYLAAKSIIENKDFEYLMKERFDNQLKASLVNRFLFEQLGNKGYNFLIKRVVNNKPYNFLYDYYNETSLQKIIYPFAKYFLRSKENRHKDCDCTWCRSRAQEYE